MTLLTETSLEPFIALLKAQGLRSVLEVCCGPGDDGIRFVRAGIHYTGVDPFDGNVRYAVSRRLSVSVAEPASLPFADHVFPAIWAVQALAGLTADEADGVVRELERVAAPGAPIAVVLP
ncbi:class I SAM-dependent methyltransferase [Arthrobacter sp. KBS0703]|jgi:demethylmenaquinone methyltransferase/2-methoxy-6-polyprenyl-1,4-benzoquinol methylase|uniref:class I SAM-dependent methyltransferase n=1 Tax=Bacteria TaxID=2 RepID=UPI00098ED02F|nr:class I SAM-dependent methyltransferase [Arthrobacter sp. KBS0703]TSE16569.1 class I SAM-dependent methyltransferase [Arthrobacter sp. KBS0703]